MIQGFEEFEFDLPEALLGSLIKTFDNMSSASLVTENVSQLPESQGVYQLLFAGQVVYIGKTDGEAGLRQRLDRHVWTIQHRCNLEPADVSFKAVRIFVFTAIDLETQLIRHYERKAKLSWNKSGFGSNDPGRERDTTKSKPQGFDANFPIDLDRPFHLKTIGARTASELLEELRSAVPYTVRAQTKSGSPRKPHPDLDVTLTVSAALTTAREVIESITSVLPPGWQATLLPGRIILYPENRSYAAGSVIARS